MEILHNYFIELIQLSAEMAPYLLLGFLLAGIAHELFPRNWIKKQLGGNGFVQSLKASLFGVPLPVCSCGIIPLAKELKKAGASNAGIASFLASTPQTGVDSIAATAGLMGWPFAIFRVIQSFLTGIITGVFISAVDRDKTSISEQSDTEVTSNNNSKNRSERKKISILRSLKYSLTELPNDIRNSLILGLWVAAGISIFLPDLEILKNQDTLWVSYLAVMGLAIPLYVCSTGSIPIAIALMASGLTPGAALIFLIAGPATNIVTIITMGSIIGWKNTSIYLVSVIGLAWLAAALIDFGMLAMPMDVAALHHHHEETSIFQWLCLALLAYGLFHETIIQQFYKWKKKLIRKNNEIPIKHIEISVTGMGCKKCAAKVTHILEQFDTIQNTQVDLEKSLVSFDTWQLNQRQITEALGKEGYQATFQ